MEIDDMKVIFLDIDGTMNTTANWQHGFEDPCKAITPECVQQLNELIAETGAKVVISSDWLFYYQQEQIVQFLTHHGFTGEVIDSIPTRIKASMSVLSRAAEIRAYLQELDVQPAAFVILDDEQESKDLEKQWVRCPEDTGFNDAKLLDRAIKILI